MVYSPYSKEENKEVIDALHVIKNFLKLRSVNIISGGPQIVDPMGLIGYAISFRDETNGFWVSITSDGKICECGATINGISYRSPKIEIMQPVPK